MLSKGALRGTIDKTDTVGLSAVMWSSMATILVKRHRKFLIFYTHSLFLKRGLVGLANYDIFLTHLGRVSSWTMSPSIKLLLQIYSIIKVIWPNRKTNGPLTRYAKSRVAHALEMPGTFSPPPQNSDPDMHHDTCVTHVPWCMPGSLTTDFLWIRWRENVPSIPGACAICNFAYLVRDLCRRAHGLLPRGASLLSRGALISFHLT